MVSKGGRDIETGVLSARSAVIAVLLSLTLSSLALAPALAQTLAQTLALSELKPAQPGATDGEQAPSLPPLDEPTVGPDGGLPEPNPIIRTQPQSRTDDVSPDNSVFVDEPPAEIITDLSQLPEPARRMRELILEAATTGEPERLRALLGSGPTATQLAISEIDADHVEYLRSISGDGEGREILAILIDLLNTGFVRIDAGQPNETYVWPYFTAVPLDSLTSPQKVELLRLVTAGDVEEMKAYGAYNFFRVGISPDGEWRFFMAVD